MDLILLIRHRLKELSLEQKGLATAAQVTESYISQLLARKKAPPAPGRTDIYERIGKFLNIPGEELSHLAVLQRHDELKQKLTKPPGPLFRGCRELVLSKCKSDSRPEIRRAFEKEAFGELERLVTQKLIDVCKRIAEAQMESEEWLRRIAHLSGQSYENMRVAMIEFLDADIFSVSAENWVPFLESMIDAWEMDLKTFSIEVTLSPLLSHRGVRRFEFAEVSAESAAPPEPGFERFLADKSLSGDATTEELSFLRSLRFGSRRPGPIYYYRELQSLRDPLHFQFDAPAPGSQASPSVPAL